MRIVSGSARGRKLRAPQGGGTRPITDRAKEGIFNMLESLGGVEGLTVADLWAGSGSFGLESLSRGASDAIFVERGAEALDCLKSNIDNLGFSAQARVVSASVESVLGSLETVDMAFCDPPYADDPWDQIFERINAPLVIGHAEREIAVASGWEVIRRRQYGRAHILVARKLDDADQSDSAQAPSVRFQREDPTASDVVALLEVHVAAARAESPPEHAHALESEDLSSSDILFYTGRLDGSLQAIGALRLLDDERAELKSMHTSAEQRGLGVGRAMLRHLIAEAQKRGIRWLGLETGTMDAFAPARALYLSEGFLPCPPFAQYDDNAYSVCMELVLEPRPAEPGASPAPNPPR